MNDKTVEQPEGGDTQANSKAWLVFGRKALTLLVPFVAGGLITGAFFLPQEKPGKKETPRAHYHWAMGDGRTSQNYEWGDPDEQLLESEHTQRRSRRLYQQTPDRGLTCDQLASDAAAAMAYELGDTEYSVVYLNEVVSLNEYNLREKTTYGLRAGERVCSVAWAGYTGTASFIQTGYVCGRAEAGAYSSGRAARAADCLETLRG